LHESESGPDVWSGRALQEDFVELAVSGLASMYPAFVWSVVLLAIMDISARDSLNDRPRPGQLGDQCSHTPETGSPQQAIAQRFSALAHFDVRNMSVFEG
jgi:hypothetical protein